MIKNENCNGKNGMKGIVMNFIKKNEKTQSLGVEVDTKKSNLYYYCEDIMKLYGVSQSMSYKLINQCNTELKEKGKIIISGRVPKSYFNERMGM